MHQWLAWPTCGLNSHSPQRGRAFHLLALACARELPSQNSCHQAPIRRTSEPYSNSGRLHSRNEIGHRYQATHCAGSPFATALPAATSAEPANVFMSHPKKARLSRILELVLVPTSQGYVAASLRCFFIPRPGAPKRSDGGLVLDCQEFGSGWYLGKMTSGVA